MYKLFFSGSSNVSLYFLKELNKFLITLIFIGTDSSLILNILKIFCLKKNIFFFQFKNIFFYNNFLFLNFFYFIKLRKIKFNAGFVFDYGFIFSLFFLRFFFYYFVNLHFSFVPFFKGCKPLLFYLVNKNFFIDFTFIYISKFFDSGRILYYYKIFFLLLFFNTLIILNIIYFFYKNIFFFIKIYKNFFFFSFNQFNFTILPLLKKMIE